MRPVSGQGPRRFSARFPPNACLKQELGGVSTLSWHERSLAPERQWDGAYRWLLAQLRQRGACVLPAREVVSWFRVRRSVDLRGADVEADRLHTLADRGPETTGPHALILRIHGCPTDRGHSGASGFIDVPVEAHSLSALLSEARPTSG